MSKDFNTYTFQDFIDDPTFVAWVIDPSGKEGEIWDLWFQGDPTNLPEMERAKRMVLGANSFRRIEADNRAKSKIWENIRYTTWTEDQKIARRKDQVNRWMRVAAGLVIGMVCLFLARNIAEQYTKVEIRTGYGELKTIYLPDSSSIMMNANTVVSYYKKWNPRRVREVWVEGEAFLDVVHFHDGIAETKSADRFVTHMPSIDVEVLGTSFNVKERKSIAEVSLKEGSVAVSQAGGRESGMNFILKPGETVYFNKETAVFEKGKTELQRNLAWRERLIKLENTPVRELISQLEDFYGIDFLVLDKTILERKVDGEFPLTDTTDIRFILSSILEKEVAVRGNQIIIR
ncbi:FecR family protein [Belliella marina]|uniref:FecR family protein n=1 Tax=Belliella marina TaxID=1644146 RepID=A0ABW4VVJ1_9BACT